MWKEIGCIQGFEGKDADTYKPRHLYEKHSSNSFEDLSIGNQYFGSEHAVCARNLCKRFGNGPPVVQNLCMNVRKGTIYSLFGSSGVGKSLLLSFIVGLRKWDSGDLLVFGETPGSKDSGIPGKRLGYMPQDLALYNQLSIGEIVRFYGRIYNMTGTKLKDQLAFLTELLNLPSVSKPIKELSGGEKRRVSLALALMNSPELIVLDEPTVGLDPLLRVNIWNYLYKICNTLGTTIIITTHYIEEARQSSTIGLMRRGRLLVEETPLNLLHRYKCELLEKVVLQLCRIDEHNRKNATGQTELNQITFSSSWNDNDNEQNDGSMNGVFRTVAGFDCDDINQYSRLRDTFHESNDGEGMFSKIKGNGIYQTLVKVYGVMVINLLPFLKHPLILAVFIILPSVHGGITLICLASKPQDLHLGIVNYESGNWSSECDLPIHSGNSCDLSMLSCQYIKFLGSSNLITLESYNNEEDALAQVHLGRSWGYLMFPQNYSQHGLELAAEKQFASNESIEGSRIHVRLDYSEFVYLFFILKHLIASYLESVKHVALACGIGGKEIEYPLLFRTPIYGDNEDNYIAFIMPGAIISSFIFLVAVVTSVLLITDRKQGTLSRARVAGLATADVMLGYLGTLGVIIIAQVVVWYGTLNLVFDFTILGSHWLFLLMCLIAGICGCALGLLFGVACKDEVEATVIGVFLTPFLLLYGGVFWPTESMSRFWQHVGYLLPTSLPTTALRSVVIRGLGLTHPWVWPGFLVLIACSIASLIHYCSFFVVWWYIGRKFMNKNYMDDVQVSRNF